MRIRGSLGLVVLASGLTLLAACGNDNDVFAVTPTATAGAAPTNTSGPPPSTPTPLGTAAPTNTGGPVKTATPTVTPGGQTATPGGPTVTPGGTTTPTEDEICGDGVVEGNEECDCGAVCLKGNEAMLGQTCHSDEECGDGGDCRPVGGQISGQNPGACDPGKPACSANCTLETVVPGTFANTCTSGTVGETCDPKAANQCGMTCTPGTCGCNGGTVSRTQLTITPLFLPIQGTQTFRVGSPRDDTVIGPSNKTLFTSGQIPLAVRVEDFHFEKIIVTGLSCACVRALEQPEFGPHLAGSGVIDCSDGGLNGVDYIQNVNHNANAQLTPPITDEACKALPGQGPTRVSGLEFGASKATGAPDQQMCVGFTPAMYGMCSGPLDGGVTWNADDPCDRNIEPGPGNNPTLECNDPHPGSCNYVPIPTFSGSGPKGSSILRTFTSISAINDGGSCEKNAQIFENGPDAEPCTDDDNREQEPMIQFTTTGTAGATVANANPNRYSDAPSGTNISLGSMTPCTNDVACAAVRGERCYKTPPTALCKATDTGCLCRTSCGSSACITEGTGQVYDCEVFKRDPHAGIGTAKTVISFGSLHAASGLDLVATTNFVIVPDPTPTQ